MPFVGAEPITVIRRNGGSVDKKGRISGIEEEVIEDVMATVNPIPGGVLETLPEGDRYGDQRRVITEFELRSSNERKGVLADHIVYEGQRYEVREVQPYRQVIPYLGARVRAFNEEEYGQRYTT